ncbi:hypothetical protein, partial [Pseudonocardia xishanensis]|uniref:hypothetical protein n=1 Tax=Pseudonocardia xishanensis TaxID=630995 RepID=UPI0031E5D644
MATNEHRVGNPLPPENPVTVAELLRRNVPAQRPAGEARDALPAAGDSDRRPLPRIPAPRPSVEDSAGPAVPDESVVVITTHAEPEPGDPRPSQIVSVGALLRREGRAPHALDRPIQPRPAQLGRRSPAAARRAAVTAGALVATGSVLAAVMVTQASNGGSGAPGAAEGSFPGMRLPDGSAAAAAGALDPGLSAPTSWMNVAFPEALLSPGTAAALGGAPAAAAPAAA